MAKLVTHNQEETLFGEENVILAAQNKSFTQMIFELLSEKEPTQGQLKIFELILSISIDHGPDTPSATKAIIAAQNGETISGAVAMGIKEINNTHGGAIEPAMEMLYSLDENSNIPSKLVETYFAEDKKIPGFGHRIYKDVDPRAEFIIKNLEENGLTKYIEEAREIEKEIENKKGKKLPLNIDGAIALALCNFGWDAKLGKAVFIIARTPGLCGHYLNCVNKD